MIALGIIFSVITIVLALCFIFHKDDPYKRFKEEQFNEWVREVDRKVEWENEIEERNKKRKSKGLFKSDNNIKNRQEDVKNNTIEKEKKSEDLYTQDETGSNIEDTDDLLKALLDELQKEHDEKQLELSNRVSSFNYLDVLEVDTMKIFSLYFYYPTTVQVSGENRRIRQQILNFKNNGGCNMYDYQDALNLFIPKIEILLKGMFDDKTSWLTLFCIPSSTEKSYYDRCEDFANRVCEELDMENGFECVTYIEDGVSKSRNHGDGKPCKIELDELFWNDKFVVMFDDVVTKGNSMLKYKQMLTDYGAHVVCGITLGQTKHIEKDYNPINDKIGYVY